MKSQNRWEKFKEIVKKSRKLSTMRGEFPQWHNIKISYKDNFNKFRVFLLNPFVVDLRNGDYGYGTDLVSGEFIRVKNLKDVMEQGK